MTKKEQQKRKRKRKPASELTTEEAMRRLFPKKVVDRLKEEAHKGDTEEDNDSSRR